MITRTKIDLSDERKLVTGMIVSTSFLKKVYGVVDPKYMESTYSKLLVTWILDYFERHKEAPMLAIQDIYHKKAKSIADENIREFIADYLTNLSREWERSQVNNVEYSTKNAIEYLRVRSGALLVEKLNSALARNDAGEVETLISKFRRLEKPEGQNVKLFHDSEAIQHALLRVDSKLFRFYGDLGTAVSWVCRSDFVAISAPPKRGKSWYMMEAGIQAALAGCRVHFVSLEMDKDQTLRRWWSAMNAMPVEGGIFTLPYFQGSEDTKYDILYNHNEVKGLPTEIVDIERMQSNLAMSIGDGDIRLSIFPSGAMTLSALEEELENMEFYENYIPDVLIIDYADILKPEVKGEKRMQLDDIWLRMRGLAQKRNIAIITGSQTGRDTTKKDAGAGDIAEHFGKIAHITKGIFLNQTKEEKDMGLIRIDCETQREGKTYTEQVVVLQGLDIGRPYLDSKFLSKVNMPTKGNGYGI